MIPLMLASAGVGAIGDLLAGVNANGQARARAKALEAGGRQALNEAGSAAQAALDEGDAVSGRAATLSAASGGGFTGSATDHLAMLSRKAMFNAHTAVYRGEAEANNSFAEASAARSAGKAALVTGIVKAGGTVLGAIANQRMTAKANLSASGSSAGKKIKFNNAPLVDVYSGQY